MAAPIGNTFNKKYMTKEEREALCDAFCKHISDGFTKISFPDCDLKTVTRVMNEHPEDFPAEKIERAEQAQKHRWEKRLADAADGINPNANATSIIFGLKNINGWRDKSDVTSGGEPIKIGFFEVDKDI